MCVYVGKRLETVRERAPTVKYIRESYTRLHAHTRPNRVALLLLLFN